MKVQNKAGRREKNPRMLKRIAKHTFPPLLSPPHTYKYQEISNQGCNLGSYLLSESCNTPAKNKTKRNFTNIQKCIFSLHLAISQATPVAEESLPTDSDLILILCELTHSRPPARN